MCDAEMYLQKSSVCWWGGVKVLEAPTLGARGSENPQESGRGLNEFI